MRIESAIPLHCEAQLGPFLSYRFKCCLTFLNCSMEIPQASFRRRETAMTSHGWSEQASAIVLWKGGTLTAGVNWGR
ncbi:mCG148005 [Mus musculus]|nr:mCG148005 [Mus musculus]